MTQYTGQTAGTAESSGGATGAVQGAAGQAGQKLQEGAQQARQQARGQIRSQLDTRSTQAGEQMSTLADTLRSTGEQLRTEGRSSHADMADRVASRVEGLGGYLTNSDADRLLDDIESFARRQPWAVAALGFGIGLVASRFLKASSESRYDQRWSSGLSEQERYGMAIPPPTYGSTGAGYDTPYGTTPGTGTAESGLASDRPLTSERGGLSADDPAFDPAFDQPTRTL